MRHPRVQRPSWEKEFFTYDKIVTEFERMIIITVKIGEGLKTVNLPKKLIELRKHSKEVIMPQWLASREGLV